MVHYSLTNHEAHRKETKRTKQKVKTNQNTVEHSRITET